MKLNKMAIEYISMLAKAYRKYLLFIQVSNVLAAENLQRRKGIDVKQLFERPSNFQTSNNVVKLQVSLASDHWMSIQMIAEKLKLTKFIVHEIVSEERPMRNI